MVTPSHPVKANDMECSEDKRSRLLFVVNVDWAFLSHRLPLAQAARDAGAEVIVAAADTGKGEAIRQEGLKFVAIPLSRNGTNPFAEARTLMFLVQLYRRVRPDLIHHVTTKPVLYGSLAARLVTPVPVVNLITGLGYMFTYDERADILRGLLKALYRVALHYPRNRTVFQNQDDRNQFIRMGLVRKEQAVLILGSGVDCSLFQPTPEPDGDPIVMLPSRMLSDKGVKEFVEAARLIVGAGGRARFVLVGDTDPGNPTAISVEQLQAWAREGVVEWWGHRDDMPQVLSNATLVVLPTYREGLPKVLLEAAACARAIVATDVPGCREIVRPDVNGILVPPRDSAALARAIQVLIQSPELRARFGGAGREITMAEFSKEIVIDQTLNLYRELLGSKWPRTAGADSLL